MEYFRKHPREDLEHGPVVDYVEERYRALYKQKPRDPWRRIRRLHEKGELIKVKDGIYKYDPELVRPKTLWDFAPEVKEAIFRRDGYRCVVCGRGKNDGVEINADHKKSRNKGGGNNIDNGQTLCSEHNLLKKRYSQYEFGKKFFSRLYEDAMKANDERMKGFCKEILNAYDRYGIDQHLWRPDR